MYSLGRIPSFDPRSLSFPMRILIEGLAPRSYHWRCDERLDQKDQPACTGFCLAYELAARPTEVGGVTNELGLKLYHEAQKYDEWPGEAYQGSSILGAFKGTKALYPRAFDSYRWCFGLDDVVLTLGYHGPVALGISWYQKMFDPDVNGNISIGGSIAGGHAILATGVNVTTRKIRLLNSWGDSWGVNGQAWISFDDMDSLLHENGEGCVAVRRHMVTI